MLILVSLVSLLGLVDGAIGAVIIINSTETWASAQMHGITPSGSGTVGDPYVYVIPDGMTFTGSGVIKMDDKYVTFDFSSGTGGLDMASGGYFDVTGSDRQMNDLGDCTIILGDNNLTGTGDFKTVNILKDSMDVSISGSGDVSVNSFYMHTSDADPGAVYVDVGGSVNIDSVDTQDEDTSGNDGGDVTIGGADITIGDIDTRALRTADSGKVSGNVVLEAYDYLGTNTPENTVNLYGTINTDSAIGTDGDVAISGVVVTLEPGFNVIKGSGSLNIYAGIVQYNMTAGDLFIDNSGGGYSATHNVLWIMPSPQITFEAAYSGDFETVSPAVLTVNLLYAEEPNTYTVEYAVTGGTAVGCGVDYYSLFTPCYMEDLNSFTENWLWSGTPGHNSSDFYADGEVDFGDFSIFGSQWFVTSGTLHFDPCQTSKTISINIVNDGLHEEDETIEVTLFNPVNATLGVIPIHTYTIVDPRPFVEFDTETSSGRENALPASIPVSLSLAYAGTVTVDYNVTGGTATGGGEDYNLPAGTLQFDPCEVTQYISITIVEDDFSESPDETIEITLSNPSNAKLGINTQHTFTILPATVQLCPKGDLDRDCDVDFNDLEIFVGQWLDPPGSCWDFNCANLDGINGVDTIDYALLAGNWFEQACPLIINEFMASNDDTTTDPQGQYDDWIEIYNASGVAIDIGGMWLKDDENWWQIPDDQPAETTIEADDYLLIWADNDVCDTPGLHASFGLAKSGDEISLYAADGVTLIDRIEFLTQVSDISYGRYPDASGNLRFFGTPTPGEENNGAYLGEVADTKFSHDRGFYESPFNLSITCNTNGAEIHYTLNGSKPNELAGAGTYLYSGPIAISQTTTLRAAAFKPGYLSSNVDAQTYIFLDDVINQPDMDPGVVATYISVIKDAFKSVPTLSIVMDANDLANLQAQDSQYPDSGLPKMELPTSAELIYADPNDGEGFQINCGIEGHSWALNKRSCKLIFKSVFGPTQLRYPFFESAPINADSAVDEFDRIVLRASKNMPVTYAGDQWTRDSQIAMSDISARGNFVHLYLNGTYWGLYNATERPDGWFTSSYFGGEKEDYFATNHGIERGEGHISGDSSRFDTMISMAQAQNLEVPSNYETFKALCDVTNFADYTIVFWFSGFGDNIDNNWYAGMRNVPLVGSVPPEGFMMFMWDAEYVFKDEGGPPGNEEPWVPPYYFSMTGHTIVDTWLALHENVDFKMLFADRVYKHCFNGGALTDNNTQARWFAITGYISDAAICELARWPAGGGYSGPATVPPEVINMGGFVTTFMTALDGWGGLYPSIEPPTFNQQGGQVPTGFNLMITNPNGSGTIYYTVDGNDPREPVTGNPVGTPEAGPTATITLNESRHVKARVLSTTDEWSALNEVTFAVGPVANNLRITEIMYHPQDTNDPNEEFIELKNIGGETLNLNLVSFTDGIYFTFPANINVPTGGYVVIVKDQTAFTSRYPSFAGVIAGEYTAKLDNGGEEIRLEDAIGQTILDFRYSDDWRSITDGNGFSLTVIDPNNPDSNSWGEKDSWRASTYFGGSPGWDDSDIVPNPGAVVINEVMAHSHLAPDWIELYNTTGGPINIGEWFLSDNDSNLMKYEIAPGTVIGVDQYLVFYEDANFGNPNDPGCSVPFALSENGEEACLSSGLDPNGKLMGYREVEDFGASERNVPFGRYFKNSTGNYNFVAMDYNTPGWANAKPKVGPIVINEIMYHPDWPPSSLYDNEKFEYIELYNISGSDVNLYDEEGNPWKFTDGIEFTFPVDANIAANGYLVVVKDPTAFAWRYGSMPPGVEVHGPYDGKLRNSGEKLEISMAGDEDEFNVRHYIRVDRINYSDGSHPEDCPGGADLWPTAADGGGSSLSRLLPEDYGNDPNNWGANTPSPGIINP